MDFNSSEAEDCSWFSFRKFLVDRENGHTLRNVTPHMYQFTPNDRALLWVAYIAVTVLAVIGNSLVLWLVVSNPESRRVMFNCLVANLAFVDLIMGLSIVPIQVPLALNSEWPKAIPHLGCPLVAFFKDFVVNVAIYTLVAIAYMRKKATTGPLSSTNDPQLLSCTGRKLQLFLIWVFAALSAAPNFYASRVCSYVDYKTESRKYMCYEWKFGTNENFLIYFQLWFLQYLAPVCVISYLYYHTRSALLNEENHLQGQISRKGYQDRILAARTVVKVTVAFAFCWSFLQTYRMLRIFGVKINAAGRRVDGCYYSNVFWMFSNWLAMSNSCYNPFIYGIFSKKFREELKKRLPFVCGKKKRLRSTTNSRSSQSSDLSPQSSIDQGVRIQKDELPTTDESHKRQGSPYPTITDHYIL